MQQHEISVDIKDTVIADKYKLAEEIGRGGWAVIYRAEHVGLKKTFAVKVLSLHMVHDANAISRFESEARIVCQLEHPNLVRIYDFGVLPNDQPYFVMDCLEGTSLSSLIEKHGPLPWQRAVKLFMQICEGLSHAHEHGILHRDIKPENVLVATDDKGDDRVYLLDFGVAKVVGADGPGNLTRTGETFGTPYYMSPEQCLGDHLDGRADVYSLGCLMYETLTGKQAFDAESAVLLMEQHLKHTPASVSQVLPAAHFPELLDDTVMTAIQRHKEDRPQSAGALQAMLQRCLTGESWTAALQRRYRRWYKKFGKRAIAIVCGVAVVAAIAAASTALLMRQNVKQPKWARQFSWQAPNRNKFEMWQSNQSIDVAIEDWDAIKASRQATILARTAAKMPDTLASVRELTDGGGVLAQFHRSSEAEPVLRRAVAICEKIGTDAKLQKFQAENALSEAIAERGDFAQSDALAKSSCREIGKLLGEQHPQYALSLVTLFSVQKFENQLPAAQDTLNRAEEIMARTSLPGDPTLISLRIEKARLLALLGSNARAKQILEQQRLLSTSLPANSYILGLLGSLDAQGGNDQIAIEQFESSLEAQSRWGKIYVELPDVLMQYAKLLRENGYDKEAKNLEEQAKVMYATLQTQPKADLFSN